MKEFFNDEEIIICVRKGNKYFMKKFTLTNEDQVEVISFEREFIIQKLFRDADEYQYELFEKKK
jgi:hypothetical protein